jgi:LCP family protein required for cell wall assembly
MGQFHTRKIRQRPPSQIAKKIKEFLASVLVRIHRAVPKRKNLWVGGALVAVGALVVIKVTFGAYHWISTFDPKGAVLSMGTELKKDANGYTNIVLLGDGGHERDGADLVDTIIVASVDFAKGTVSMLSIPRDYYLKSAEFGTHKINEIYRNFKKEMGENAYSMFAKAGGEITGLDVPYYARIDFGAFVEIVDGLGGITVEVGEPIYDPYYPNEQDNGYTVFEVKAGPQEMNGETALKFARSRKTTSDFDRALRQQQVIMAIKERAMSKEVLTDPKVLKKLYEAVQDNLSTNLSLTEMITVAGLAQKIDRSKLVTKVLHDDPLREGGFLVTPERQYTNNQFALVPYGGNLDMIRQYSDLIFNHRDIFQDPARIEVLNGTKEPGVARAKADRLKRFGFTVVNIDNLTDKAGNRKNVDKSFIRYNSWEVDKDGNVLPHFKSTIGALAGFVKGEAVPSDELMTEASANLSVVVGADATK